jgi:hypothetical protein
MQTETQTDILEQAIAFAEAHTQIVQGGLYADSGLVLLNAYLYQHTQDDTHLDRCIALLEQVLEQQSQYPFFTFAGGYGGVAWLLAHLKSMGILEENLSELIDSEIDNALLAFAQNELQKGEFDMLHAGLGSSLYFYETDNVEALRNILASLDVIATKLPNGDIYWTESPFYRKEDKDDDSLNRINLSLSHGMASILYFLGLCVEKHIELPLSVNLLNGSMQWFKKQILHPSGGAEGGIPGRLKVFADGTIEKPTDDQTPLRWCYGDLGIAVMLYTTGQRTHNAELMNEGLALGLSCTTRTNDAEFVKDTQLCHGTAGIAHIFNRLYLDTGRYEFKIATEFWLDETLNRATQDDDSLLFLSWHHEDGYINDNGFLEGASGVYLALLSIQNGTVPAWDRCLFLS